MFGYLIRRLLWMIPSFFAVSLVTFVIIQLPPGDFVTSYAADLATSGAPADPATLDELRQRYGLDDPMPLQYLRWIGNVAAGDLGDSFEYRTPVANLIWGRLGMTALVAICTLLFVWLVSFPIGIYSAVKQYSVGRLRRHLSQLPRHGDAELPAGALRDVSLGGLSRLFGRRPVLARLRQCALERWRGSSTCCSISGSRWWCSGSPASPPWSASCGPICSTSSTSPMSRPARAKGLRELTLMLRYPTRVALNPFVSTVGWVLPVLVSGDVIVSSVLSLPTAGPILIQALKTQDMYLAGALIMFQCILVLVGTLLSDLLLVWLDPRIRYDD